MTVQQRAEQRGGGLQLHDGLLRLRTVVVVVVLVNVREVSESRVAVAVQGGRLSSPSQRVVSQSTAQPLERLHVTLKRC